MKYFFASIFLHLIIATPQINLYYTDWISQYENESNNTLQHNCLRIIGKIIEDFNVWETKIFCMSELPSKFHVEKTDRFPNFTFVQLAKQNVTSQHLYHWSAPIDLIERYQYYLNQPSTSLGTDVFYNCTMPRFGPICQYELDYYRSHHLTLHEIILDAYHVHRSFTTTFACYIHLNCNHDPYPSCLDWSEICDGKIDCLDSGVDEEHCWQLEIHECNDNEYRCMNGQCIPKSFFRDQDQIIDCIDSSDKTVFYLGVNPYCHREEPSFRCDDVRCQDPPWESFCRDDRRIFFWNAMYTIQNNSIYDDCWSMLRCIFQFIPYWEMEFCRNLCSDNECIKTILKNCPDMLYFPNVPVFFGDVYIAFRKNYPSTENIGSLYTCSNNSHYDAFFNMSASKILFNNTTCFIYEIISYRSTWSDFWNSLRNEFPRKLYGELKKYTLIYNYNLTICNRSNMYQCMNSSKCISIHRLMNSVYDCPYMDDENMTSIKSTDIERQLKQTHYKCQVSNRYIHRSLIENFECDCESFRIGVCEDENPTFVTFQKDKLFQYVCDGSVELMPIEIDGQNETDETECQQWECDNIYTRCNSEWNCPNGEDEIGCNSPPLINCSLNHRICVSPQTNLLICLPIEKVNDGNIDCLGGTDESILCRSKPADYTNALNFYCKNQTFPTCIDRQFLCNGKNNCEHGDDEQFCLTNDTFEKPDSNAGWFLCERPDIRTAFPSLDFSKLIQNVEKNIAYSSSSIMEISYEHDPRCYRGLDLRVWLDDSSQSTRRTCLCPSSFYGDQCQYQNQRISLTIKFRALSDSWKTQFAIVVLLIDDSDQRVIHSYEQLSFLWVKSCKMKFNIYLLYSTRPKDLTKNYSIHIDFYEKVTLVYRGSVQLPVNFPFLPVQRLSFIVDIPRVNDKTQSCSNDQCNSGQCIRYSNNPENPTFCRCNRGWSGRYCTIRHSCTCSSDSLCIGVSANNQSICVCPMNKFGPRCLLTDTVCQNEKNSTCENGGQCISNADYMAMDQNFICICPEGFSGERCEIADNKLTLSFNKDIVVSQHIFIHFFHVNKIFQWTRVTTFRTTSLNQDSLVIYWALPFYLVFIELSKKHYYLTVLQKTYNQSIPIEKMINPTDRCPHISELFNQTFLQWHLLRHIKYYHLPCQRESLNLSCFYDDVHFCVCYTFGQKRLANCFHFDHNMTFDCYGQSECENNGQCFQDSPDCPQRSICMCQPCFYGRRCQFSTSGFGLSLDAIIGYHIQPNVSLTHQSAIVKFSFALTIIFIVAGLINGMLCLITFKNKSVREVGCGLYLFGSSITTLLIMVMFGLKFFILLLAQMAIISNRSFLEVQCRSLDFILRICICMDQWLSACVALERAMTIIKATRFNKRKSKQAAKYVITILGVIIAGSCIHDPFHRHVIEEGNNDVYNEDDQKRTWCIVTYPHSFQVYNSFMHTFHFCGPFLINLISTIILIVKKSRQQSIIHKQQSYKEILREQLQQHKYLLVAPVVLIILALPRLIIASVSKCMKSSDDSWLFTVGYFISFFPPMLTFVIFIVPSEFYKKEFKKSIQQFLK